MLKLNCENDGILLQGLIVYSKWPVFSDLSIYLSIYLSICSLTFGFWTLTSLLSPLRKPRINSLNDEKIYKLCYKFEPIASDTQPNLKAHICHHFKVLNLDFSSAMNPVFWLSPVCFHYPVLRSNPLLYNISLKRKTNLDNV